MLDERKRRILQAIIDDYIASAEPVGSRAIARKHNLGVSPATIRNEMSDLEVLGYLEQPHASAGRIPSAKGYRFYVDCLLEPAQITENDIALINTWYISKVHRIEEVFQETAKMLSRMTRNISIVLAPQTGKAAFRYLQFLPFDDHRVIAVVVGDSGIADNKIIDVPEGIEYSDLQRLAERINNRLAGVELEKIHTSSLHEISDEIASDRNAIEMAIALIRQSLVTDKSEQKVYLGGTTQLLNQPEFRDVERVKGLLTMLEEERLLVDILHNQNNEGVVVTIGHENKYSGIQDCSMVQATYRVDGRVLGSVAVLGPTRMEYSKIMTVLDFMSRHLGEIIKKYNRK